MSRMPNIILIANNAPLKKCMIEMKVMCDNQNDFPEYIIKILSGEGAGIEFKGDDYFEAMQHWREWLERHGLRPAIYGAIRDVYPSRLQRDMGGGAEAHRLIYGQLASDATKVNIFDAVDESEYENLADVLEQRDFRLNLLRGDGS